MTSETDEEFVERLSDFIRRQFGIADGTRIRALARRGAAMQMAQDDQFARIQRLEAEGIEAADRIEQLEAEAKTRTLDYLGQVGQLSEELERVKREAERAQDAHGVRFLNYLEETARLADEITRLKAELHIAQEASDGK